MAEISVERVASPKVTNFRVLNPGTFLAKLAKLCSSKGMRLFSKSLIFEPPGGYLLYVSRQVLFKWTFGRQPPPNRPQFGGAVVLFCISIGNVNWKKFLRWKLLDNICSSEVEQNHQTKTSTCEFENFLDKFFPIFGRIETFQIMFVITSFVAKMTKVTVDAILRKKI